jgi:hypothetical protein
MTDLAALKARLSDPREVARLLGLKGQRIRGGVMTPCPIHRNKSLSLALMHINGVLAAKCYGCSFGPNGNGGDILDLLQAIEGDFKRALARAQEMAGGAVGATYEPEPARERLPPDVYHELATRIIKAGRLDGRACVREVEEYLARRRLLELAQEDGWACLPGLRWLLKIAEEVCDVIKISGPVQGSGSVRGALQGVQYAAHKQRVRKDQPLAAQSKVHVEKSNEESLTVHSLLIAADLARYNQRGEFVPTWGRWRLVIPWRGPDGRINCLQRRRTWEHSDDGPEPAKYVFPFWRPDWPYGSERVGDYGTSGDERGGSVLGDDGRQILDVCQDLPRTRITPQRTCYAVGVSVSQPLRKALSDRDGHRDVAIVEGAPDTLAMRALHPAFLALGLPGITNWRPEWAKLVLDFVGRPCKEIGHPGKDVGAGYEVPPRDSLFSYPWRICLDRGKPDQRGLIPEDMASARIALDLACGEQAREMVIEWWGSRHRRGRALGCVLCGAPEPWLCRGCGRRRAKGKDWAEDWAAKQS